MALQASFLEAGAIESEGGRQEGRVPFRCRVPAAQGRTAWARPRDYPESAAWPPPRTWRSSSRHTAQYLCSHSTRILVEQR